MLEKNEKSTQEYPADKNDSGDPQSIEEENNNKRESNEDKENLKENVESTKANKNESEQKLNKEFEEKNISSAGENELTQEQQNRQQALEQWLRKIPDDPGRLLRNKMHREYQRRGKKQTLNEHYW